MQNLLSALSEKDGHIRTRDLRIDERDAALKELNQRLADKEQVLQGLITRLDKQVLFIQTRDDYLTTKDGIINELEVRLRELEKP